MLNPLPQESWSRRNATHLLQRAAFGGSPEEQEAFYQLGKEQGIEAAVDSLLETTEDWSALPWPEWMQSEVDPNGETYGNQGIRRREYIHWYFRLLLEGQPLASKLLKFFIDHFAVDSATVGQYYRWIGMFRYTEMLRKHAAGNVAGEDTAFEGDERLVPPGHYGNFKTLVNHVSWSLGMIRTLDLYQSNRGNVNENFGRELLELFALGIGSDYTNDPEYTEEDVAVAADAFTGRKFYNFRYFPDENRYTNPAGNQNPPLPPASVWQNLNQQDRNTKGPFYGYTTTPAGGPIIDGDDIIEVIFDTDRCAKHLSWKLWRYFASPNPSKELVQTLAYKFRDDHDYEIRPFLKDLFLSEEFYAESVVNAQIKDAGDYFVSLVKQLGAALPTRDAMEDLMQQLGYEVLFPPSIAGWPEPDGPGNTWLATGAMVFRMNMPSIFTHHNYDVFVSARTRNTMDDFPEVDWNVIAPKELRRKEKFPLLLEELKKRFMPSRELRKSQVRTLFDRYSSVSDELGELEGVRELVRLILALPEYQTQ